MNPCHSKNRNSQTPKPGENYYYFKLNEMCEFQEFDEKAKDEMNFQYTNDTPIKIHENNPKSMFP